MAATTTVPCSVLDLFAVHWLSCYPPPAIRISNKHAILSARRKEYPVFLEARPPLGLLGRRRHPRTDSASLTSLLGASTFPAMDPQALASAVYDVAVEKQFTTTRCLWNAITTISGS
ncbi:hypothetical protein ISCGN_019497 [Ixodes scapularis]